LATTFFLATLRLAGALRAVVFLAATGPPRGKTFGLPEGSCDKVGRKIDGLFAFLRISHLRVASKYQF
jgi:hypothetical protein